MARPAKPRVQAEFGDSLRGRRALWQDVTDGIRKAILSGSISPGSNLIEADLADRFAVSRGPIREALRELAAEGLVVDVPRRGALVSTLTFADLREVYSIREGLEGVAAGWAIERATDEQMAVLLVNIRSMEAAWESDVQYADSLAQDLEFHRNLVAMSGNRRVVVLYEQMLSQTQLLARTAETVNPHLAHGMTAWAHQDIYDALLARDVSGVRDCIRVHYEEAEERLFRGLGSSQSDADNAAARWAKSGWRIRAGLAQSSHAHDKGGNAPNGVT